MGLFEIFLGKGLVPHDIREVGAVLQKLLSPLVLKLGLVLVLREGKTSVPTAPSAHPAPAQSLLPWAVRASQKHGARQERAWDPPGGRSCVVTCDGTAPPLLSVNTGRCHESSAHVARRLSATLSHFTGDEAEAQRSPLPQVAQPWRSGVGWMPALEPAGCLQCDLSSLRHWETQSCSTTATGSGTFFHIPLRDIQPLPPALIPIPLCLGASKSCHLSIHSMQLRNHENTF